MAKLDAVAVLNTQKNKQARLVKHVKAHEKDAQAAKHVGKTLSTRTTPETKGNFRKVNKHYRDEAGHVLAAPMFAPKTRVAK